MEPIERLASCAGFDWDAGNGEKNQRKHGVSRAECEEVFFNRPLVVAEDAAHSRDEARFYALGHADGGKMLFVVFTLRGALVRVISARPMSRNERKVYGSQ
ncbi:MAG TPA: BrnT family toxin [Longimicrobiaceae bacterium]|nr:BrnT family toxin [Longimicrobiaceae bacterium]